MEQYRKWNSTESGTVPKRGLFNKNLNQSCGDVTKTAKKQFVVIVQLLDTEGFYIEPCLVDGLLSGWNLMKNGLHYHYLTDSLNFSQVKGVANNIDDIFQQY